MVDPLPGQDKKVFYYTKKIDRVSMYPIPVPKEKVMRNVSVHRILGIHITDRVTKAASVQSLLSEYGCFIVTRLGLHESSPDFCAPNGLLILEMLDNEVIVSELIEKLNMIEGIEIQQMTFKHP